MIWNECAAQFDTVEKKSACSWLFISRLSIVLPTVIIAHLTLIWWVVRYAGPYAQGSAAMPPITVVLMQGPTAFASASLTPLTATFLRPEINKMRQAVPNSRRVVEERATRNETRAVHQESAAGYIGPESAQSQSVGKSALVLPDFRDAYFKKKSAGEMANEQLNPNGKRDRWVEGIQGAAVPDCVEEKIGGGLLGIPVLIYKAASGKCK
ncbi:Hypothetical protein mma_3557 [Janthinobacterium sp. Marseille]|nr:hypothetical protein [Janthinobacterium sp. Marseille]ABR91503.1 Hypothetical protein mma_3557 [Janthinobacterium sp. Marseille]